MADHIFAWLGLLGAAMSYGSSYVPARSYPIHDGLTFGWYQCLGLLIASSTFSLLYNDWSAPAGISPAFYVHWEGLLSGAIYQLANVCGTQAVSKIGLGVYYTVHEFPNVGATLILGFLGPIIGFPCKVPSNLGLALVGAFFVGLGMVPIMLMKEHHEEKDNLANCPKPVLSSTAPPKPELAPPGGMPSLFDVFPESVSREDLSEPLNSETATRRDANSSTWSFTHLSSLTKQLGASLATPMEGSMLEYNSHTWDGTTKYEVAGLAHLKEEFSHVTAGLFTIPASVAIVAEDEDWNAEEGRELQDIKEAAPRNSQTDKAEGLALSLLAGLLYGVMFSPMPLWQQRMRNAGVYPDPFNFVFAVSLGSAMTSTAWLLLWSTVKRLRKQKLDKSVIRPALLAGAIYFFALLLEYYAMAYLPYAVAYIGCMGMSLTASMSWGIFVFGEMKGCHNRCMAALSFVGVTSGAICLGLAA